jgi:hypothetical protein
VKSGDKKANMPHPFPAFLRFRPWLIFVWLMPAIPILPAGAAAPPAADSCRTPPTLLTRLEEDIADGRLDDYSLIQSAFILSGAVTEDSLTSCMTWYDGVLTRLRALQLDPFNRLQSASTVFSYLHAFYLLEYKEEATTLLDVVRRHKFNCVAGTILYNLVCADLGWPTEAFETPSHVYTIFPNFTQTVTVENTSPMGFNIMRNLQSYSAYLLSYYPAHRTAQIGLDKLYAYENSHGRRINNTELLGLLAYNRAYFARQRNDFAGAYEFVLLAQQFNRDSRSNVLFEQELYFHWGKDLFDAGSFDAAFSVYADGAYRYPDMKELGQNCRASFFQALHRHQQQFNWPESRRLILEMADLDLLEPEQQEQLNALLMEWADYLYRSSQITSLRECLDLVDTGRMNNGFWQVMRRAAGALPE